MYRLNFLSCRSGLTVITACGVHNFDLVKSYGADACFDYKDPECGKKVREYTGDKIEYVFDTISTESSAAVCADAMCSTGGRYTCILAVDFPRKDCKTDLVMGYTINGEDYKMGPAAPLLPAKRGDYEFGEMFFRMAEELLAAGKFRPHRATVGKGGLNGVLEGLQLMREEKVSGTKLVYRVEDTP
jgi:NADPH:quinone reductase-like Zn-dependent oxidoreductase